MRRLRSCRPASPAASSTQDQRCPTSTCRTVHLTPRCAIIALDFACGVSYEHSFRQARCWCKAGRVLPLHARDKRIDAHDLVREARIYVSFPILLRLCRMVDIAACISHLRRTCSQLGVRQAMRHACIGLHPGPHSLANIISSWPTLLQHGSGSGCFDLFQAGLRCCLIETSQQTDFDPGSALIVAQGHCEVTLCVTTLCDHRMAVTTWFRDFFGPDA
jgi:hypothetical protein